ncbi:Nodulin-like domain-containing protein [Citrus sinensis]|uniref:Nodulin-like domain-containing protein n=1 Tax=Citrus sinensis TaxID=2711 RepID=A0ACB8LS51_CITSI|nr:Nodulin-like domain-containing protein [Citrus sinensis]
MAMEEEMPSSKSKSKWMATVASIWIQCSIGATYTFGIYSSALKSTLNYDQSTLETVSVCEDIGGSAGVLSGLLFSSVTFNRHPRLRPVPVPLMCLFIFMAAQGQNFFNTTDVVTRLINFGDYSGTIVGLYWSEWSSADPSPSVRIYGTNSLDDRKHLNGFAAIAVLFDVYFTVNTICDNLLSF